MRIALQLYTVRNQLAENPWQTYEQIRDIGIEYVEGGGSFGAASAEEGRKLLDEFGLKASGSHIGIDRLESDLQAALDEALTFGCKYVIVPWVGSDIYAAGWDAFGKRLEAIAEPVQAAGLSLAYHNHDFEFKNPGKPGLDVLFDSTNPDLVKSELDVAWVQIGGGVPADYIRKLSNRLPLVHLKDFDPDKNPRWQPCGQGVVDWDSTLDAIEEAGPEFGAIELDEFAGEPMDAVRMSYEFFTLRGYQ